MTNNNGMCCLSDNIVHDFCMVKPIHENNVHGIKKRSDLSQCKERCSKDPFCKGFSINIFSNLFRIKLCFLYTTTNHSGLCNDFYARFKSKFEDDMKLSLAVGPLDPKAVCVPQLKIDTGPEEGNFEGCHIKTKYIKGKNYFNDNHTQIGVNIISLYLLLQNSLI